MTRPGMTLVELLVAVAILVMMIAGVGYVFSHTSQAVRLTQATIETNAGARAALARLREDLQSMTKDGVLFIADGSPDAGMGGEPSPPILMFTATGRFQSAFDSGSDDTANTALIIYMPVKDSQGGPDILARYVLPLSGDPSLTWTAETGLPWSAQNPNVLSMEAIRIHGASLADIRTAARIDAFQPGNFLRLYAQRVWSGYAQLNSAPQTVGGDPNFGGGVENLWPYLVGGCDTTDDEPAFAVRFYDGVDEDGERVDVDYPAEPTAWMDLSDTDMRMQRTNYNNIAGVYATPAGGSPAYMLWDWRNKSLWPRALKVTLRLRDPAGRLPEARTYEAVFELP